MQHVHVRFLDERTGNISNTDGATIAWEQNKRRIRVAIATCAAGDNFNKKKGTTLATERLASKDAIEFDGADLMSALMSGAGDTTGAALVRSMVFLKRINKAEVLTPEPKAGALSAGEGAAGNSTVRALQKLQSQFGIK